MTEVDGVVYKITETQANCFRTAFGIFDTDGDGFVTCEDFPKLYRSVGQSPSEAQLRELLQRHKPSDPAGYSLKDFLRICESEEFESRLKEEKLIECFRIFDCDGTGTIAVNELRFILQQLGEPLTDDEADKFIEWALKVPDATTDGGLLYYDILAKELIKRDPDVM